MPSRTASKVTTGHRLRRRVLAAVGAAFVAVPAANVASASVTSAVAPVAPATGGRVDLTIPKFSHGTTITNRLFPITTTKQMMSFGHEGPTVLRQETTLLNRTRTLRVNGQDVQVVVSQFVAHGDGQIVETAIDYFAQADDGSVWYFGEDVSTYENGVVASHNGTWLAGRDGPPGMIMPAHPKVGDVYRPENIPGLVFEETTVKATNLNVPGPSGTIHGAIRVEEHPADGDVETKIYAPGYGEFEATVPASDEHVLSGVAVPTDVRGGSEPIPLNALSDRGRSIYDGAASTSLKDLRSVAAAAHTAWNQLASTKPPALLAANVEGALDELDAALASRKRADIAQAGLHIEFATTDLEMQYTDYREVDHDRAGSWGRQRKLDEAAGDTAAVASDKVIGRSIRDRLAS